jgi:regulator of replication initiation timing
MFANIKKTLDNIEQQLNEAKKEREEYKGSYRNVVAENERLKEQIAALQAQTP